MPKSKQQGIVHIGLILLLLAGLVAGVYLVQHPQIFKPKASGDVLWLVDENGQRLPLKEGTDVFEVSSQQIHIKVSQPKWQASLPGLVGEALAQSTACNGAVYSCSDIKCDDDSIAPGTGCYEADNNRYYIECRRNCPTTTVGQTTTQQPAGQTGQPAQPQVDTTTPTISGSVTWTENNLIAIPGANFGSDGTVYYSAGGSSQTPFSKDQISWSSSLIKTNNDRIPECTAVKTVDCLIKGGYVKVCRSDNKCSAFAQIPDRQIKQESPGTPQGQGAPAAPTQEEVTEATAKMRISMDQSKLESDVACTEDADPQKNCLQFTPGDLAAQALIGKDYVDWWLANTPGEAQTIYVRFVSNKGKEYKLNGLDSSIKVIYQPAQPSAQPSPAAGGPALPTPSPRSSPSPSPAADRSIRGKLVITGDLKSYLRRDFYLFRLRDPNDPSKGGEFAELEIEKCAWTTADITGDQRSQSFACSRLSDPRYIIIVDVATKDGRTFESNHDRDCPKSPPGGADRNCVVEVNSNPQIFTINIPYLSPPGKNMLETLTGSPDVVCTEGEAYLANRLDESPLKTGYGCRCSQGTIRIVDLEKRIDSATTRSPCQLPPSLSPSPSPAPEPAALPITGKVKITANGRAYDELQVRYFGDDDWGPWSTAKRAFLRDFSPSIQGQEEVSYITEPIKGDSVEIWAAVILREVGWVKSRSKDDCPENLTKDGYGCVVTKGSTQNLSVILPASDVFYDEPNKGTPDNPAPDIIYVKNNSDRQVLVQKVEQLTLEPEWSWWIFNSGAKYTQLDCRFKPSDVFYPKDYGTCEAIVTACSRSDMENKKEKGVKVTYQVDRETRMVDGKYQCGGSGLVNIP